MSTCGICLKEFAPGVKQARGHQACVDGEMVGRLREDNAILQKDLNEVTQKLYRKEFSNE